jgi:hypothetical protein
MVLIFIPKQIPKHFIGFGLPTNTTHKYPKYQNTVIPKYQIFTHNYGIDLHTKSPSKT